MNIMEAIATFDYDCRPIEDDFAESLDTDVFASAPAPAPEHRRDGHPTVDQWKRMSEIDRINHSRRGLFPR